VLVARAADGSIHGVATYERIATSRGQLLTVEKLITFELNRRKPARRALCEALDRIADRLGCSGVALPIDVSGRSANDELAA
jgi:ribosomal protein S3